MTSMKQNMEQYIVLLESHYTPENLRGQVKDALYAMAELADAVIQDPITSIKPQEPESIISISDKEEDEIRELLAKDSEE